jgi:glucose-specific phosphotransferase system IIA component
MSPRRINMTSENSDHTATTVNVPTSVKEILVPVSGTVIALGEIADPVFSSGALGSGAGIQPSEGTFLAPIDGEIVTVMAHAYGIRGGGLEVLVHIGIDTVELNGQHFAPAVSQGTHVRAGDMLGTANLVAIADAGYQTTVVVIVTNSGDLGDIATTHHQTVAAGDVFITATI